MATTTLNTTGRSTWDLDAKHSSVGFSVRHLVISRVSGRFTQWSGSLLLDPAHPETAELDVRIEAASIDTAEPQRDAHLRSADFFDAETFPTLTFRSTGVRHDGGDRLVVLGDLTIRGVTRPVELAVETLGAAKDPWGGSRVGFAAKTSIDRRDFGLTWNQALEAGGVLVGDKVEIAIDAQAVQRVEK